MKTVIITCADSTYCAMVPDRFRFRKAIVREHYTSFTEQVGTVRWVKSVAAADGLPTVFFWGLDCRRPVFTLN